MNQIYDAVRYVPRQDAEPDPIRCRRCAATTRQGKPYCTAHVAEMPYVAALQAELATGRPERAA